MVGIKEADHDFLRFLWFKQPEVPHSEMAHLRFIRLVFGLRPSPAILGAIISQHLMKYKESFPELVRKIESSLYVDDLVAGTSNLESAIQFYENSKRIMSEAGMNLCKWKSNSKELMTHVNKSEDSEIRSQEGITEEDESFAKATTGYIVNSEEQLVKLLGVGWDASSDDLTFNIHEVIKYAESLTFTKRSLLRFTAKLFDPLGFLSPYVIQLKILFQEFCSDHKGWDDPLQGETLEKCKSIVLELHYLAKIKVPRYYFEHNQSICGCQLHGFCDASKQAYAAVVYLRSTYEDGHVNVRMIASKTRVGPTKPQTIPRLELLGALILSRLMSTILRSLPDQSMLFYWTDSMTALHWICNPREWKQYVSNRVTEIRCHSTLGSWRHCPGSCNPADLPSRGINSKSLSSCKLWWMGPEFLLSPQENWPEVIIPPTSEVAEAELVKNPPLNTHTVVAVHNNPPKNLDAIIDCNRFGSFHKLLRVTTYVLRFAKLLKQCEGSLLSDPSPGELTTAELYWIQSIQGKAFYNEIQYLKRLSQRRPIRVDQFNLFLDKDLVLKCRGRIGNANVSETA